MVRMCSCISNISAYEWARRWRVSYTDTDYGQMGWNRNIASGGTYFGATIFYFYDGIFENGFKSEMAERLYSVI